MAADAGAAATTGSGAGGVKVAVMPVAITRMADWSVEKVADWLKENDLQHVTDK